MAHKHDGGSYTFFTRLSTLLSLLEFLFSLILQAHIWSNPQTCKKSKSESLVFGWESRWLSCWWQPLSLLSGFLLQWDKIYDYGEGWRERNPRRLSLAYLDFCSQHSLSPCRTQVGDLDKNVAYCCNRYCCCRLTYGHSGRMRNGRKGKGERISKRTQ